MGVAVKTIITGVPEVESTLKKLARKYAGPVPEAVVGYTQAYALYVHENMEAKHKEGKSAKYLENPMRSLRSELKKTITKAMDSGVSLQQALLLAGLRLQRESQKIVPIDTGALKASAFTATRKNVEAKAAAALSSSNAKKKKS